MSRAGLDRKIAPEAFQRLVSGAGDDARALAGLAAAALWSGNEGSAYALACRARSLAPDDPEVWSRTSQPLAAGVGSWHVRMLRDETRNRAFDEALRGAVRPGMRVLDIGSGSGLLAMMAARAGAAFVVSCEMNPALADTAREIVGLNGLSDRVRIVSKSSLELDPETDLGGRADLLVSEIIANDLLSESVLPVFEDASRRLLKPGAPVIPAAGEAMVALARWTGVDKRPLADVSGFDLSPFNRFEGSPYRLDGDDPRLSLASEPTALLRFDFAGGGPWRGGQASLELAAAAPANGIVQWVRLKLDSQALYENPPRRDLRSAWPVLFTPLHARREARPGESLRIAASWEPTRILLWAER